MDAEDDFDWTDEGAVFIGFEGKAEVLPRGIKLDVVGDVSEIAELASEPRDRRGKPVLTTRTFGTEGQCVRAFQLDEGPMLPGIDVRGDTGILPRE